MKKTLIAAALGLAIGASASVQAQTITITTMKMGGAFGASGTMNSNGDGQMVATQNFNGHLWTATQQNWFDTHSSVSSWSGDGSAGTWNASTFSYTFHLSSNQVAAGTFFDWNGNLGIPVLTIYDCAVTGPSSCLGKSLGMAIGPFPGNAPKFLGSTQDDFAMSGAVPVPAAVWLMGSGLLGLVGVARRRKVA